uniref:ORF n=1 Tax=Saccharomyces cerevisiae TaxID=4932 RepID=A2P1U9_YEASX|nr:ORF [Saccharomyces cerevisiae]
MQKELTSFFVISPSRSTKERSPIVGRNWITFLIVTLWRSPEKPVTLWISLRRSTLLEPFMLFRTVVDNQVNNNLDTSLMSFFYHLETILIGTVTWPNLLIVGNIVTHIFLRRVIKWAHPYRIDT